MSITNHIKQGIAASLAALVISTAGCAASNAGSIPEPIHFDKETVEQHLFDFYEMGQYNEAMAYLEANRSRLDESDYHNIKGNLLYELGEDYRGAAYHLLNAKDYNHWYEELSDANKANLSYLAATSCNEIGDYETALKQLKDMERFGFGAEGKYAFFMEQGNAYFGLGNYEKAQIAYGNALEIKQTEEAKQGYSNSTN